MQHSDIESDQIFVFIAFFKLQIVSDRVKVVEAKEWAQDPKVLSSKPKRCPNVVFNIKFVILPASINYVA
jgi:hypothetical protein